MTDRETPAVDLVHVLGVGVPRVELARIIRDHVSARLLADRRRPAGEPAFRSAPWAELERRLHAGAQLWGDSSTPAGVLSCAEFGRRVRLDPSTVRRYAAAGRIEGAYLLGNVWAIPSTTTTIQPRKGTTP